jgi:hypothetical protein
VSIGPEVRTPAGDAPVIPVLLLGTGMYLAWFGVHYFKQTRPDGSTLWPSDPVKAVLQGQSVQTAADTSQTVLTAAFTSTASSSSSSPAASSSSPSSSGAAVSSTAQQNQQIGQMLAAAYGWGSGSQWDDLVTLWNDESSWDNRVWNGGSTADKQPAGASPAYGIAQADPYTKYPKAGQPPGYGGTADPTTQIAWGLAYIKGTYGSPSAALAHENSAGWY